VSVLVLVMLLHLGCYWTATRVTESRGPEVLVRLATPLDDLVPHLPWSWPFYWLTYPFVVLGSGAALLRLGDRAFRRAITALAGITLVGAVVQILLPAEAPWPPNPAPLQRLYHESALVLPYANLPSMHVTYVTVTAGMLGSVFAQRWVRRGAALIAAGVVISTVTLKEHVVLDALAGLLLAAGALLWWRKGIRGPELGK